VAKGKKAKRASGPAELLVIEAEQYPVAVIVELWHKGSGGKREFLDSRRYEAKEPDSADDEPARLAPVP